MAVAGGGGGRRCLRSDIDTRPEHPFRADVRVRRDVSGLAPYRGRKKTTAVVLNFLGSVFYPFFSPFSPLAVFRVDFGFSPFTKTRFDNAYKTKSEHGQSAARSASNSSSAIKMSTVPSFVSKRIRTVRKGVFTDKRLTFDTTV